MTQEPPHQHLLEEFQDAFNVEGLAETRLTCEAKGRILEAAVEKAKWCIGSGCHSQDSIYFEQSVLGIRELITHNTDDPRYINFPPWALKVSRSFFRKICSAVEQNLHPDAAALLQRVTVPHKLLSTLITDGPSPLVTHNSDRNLPSLLPQVPKKPAVYSPKEHPHPTSRNQGAAATNRKRRRTKESISPGKDKGKRRALREEHVQRNARVSLEFNVEKPTAKGYHVGKPSVERGEAGPSDWAGRCRVRQPLEPAPLDVSLMSVNKRITDTKKIQGVLAPPPPSPMSGLPPSERFIDGRSNHGVTSLDQNYRQFLENIMKAHQIALMPSERVRLNLCISLASHMNGVPAVPLIGGAPIFQPATSSNVPSPNSQLVHDCQNGLVSASHRSVSRIRNYSLCSLVDIAQPPEGERNKSTRTRTQGDSDSRSDVSVPLNVTQEVQPPVNSDFDAKVPESVVSENTLSHPRSPITTQPACGGLELSRTPSHRPFAAKGVTLRAQPGSAYIQAPGIQTNISAASELVLQPHSRDDSKMLCEHEKQLVLYPDMAGGSQNCASPLRVPLMYSPPLGIPQGTSLSVVPSAVPVPVTWMRTNSHHSYVQEAILSGPKSMTPMTCGPSPRAEDLTAISLPQMTGQAVPGNVLSHIYTNQQSPVAFPTPSSLPSTLEYEITRIGKVFSDTYDPPPLWNQHPPDPSVYIRGDGEDGPLQNQPPKTFHWSGNQLDLEP